MNEPVTYREEDIIEQPVSVSHFVRVLSAYSTTIWLSLAGIAIAYGIIALAAYLVLPSQSIVSQPFSLDFPRATEGKYPNGLKFSTNEILSTPVLARVYKENRLDRYMTLDDFIPCVYILESNPEFEKLQREYQARLNDPKISSIERQQIEKDYTDKQESLSHNLFSLNISIPDKRLPDDVSAKILTSILNGWADRAQNEGRITSYDVTVLSPAILDDKPGPNLVITIRILIKRLSQVLDNMDDIGNLPSASLSRTKEGHLSLQELRIKIEDLIRFRLEPTVALARESRGNGDPATVQFVKTQLDYDQRQLAAYQDRTSAIRDALALYTSQRTVSLGQQQTGAGATNQRPSETVMPQVSDTFIDRMAQLLNQSADVQYRQKLVTQLRVVQNDMIPAQQAVRYDEQLMREITTPSSASVPDEQLTMQVEAVRAEAKSLVQQVNDLFTIISQNLNPQTYLYSLTAPAQKRVQRSITLGRLGLIGALILLISLPLIVLFCLLHHRVAEEDQMTHPHLQT
jgi:hypothetical protein